MQLERDQECALARSLPCTFFFPYFDRDLAHLVLRIHPRHLIAGGWAKAPLRRLVAERLPMVALRTKKVDFTAMAHAELRRDGPTAWRALGGPSALADLRVVVPRRVESFMSDYFRGGHDDAAGAWLLLTTEAWLQARPSQPLRAAAS